MIYRFADCELDVSRLELRRGGELQLVEPQVFEVLRYLVERPQQFVSKDEIFAAVWKGRIVSDAALASPVKAARQAVGDIGAEQSIIRTVHGRGLLFVAETTLEDSTKTIRKAGDLTPSPPGQAEHAIPQRALPDRPSIAVMPFASIGADQESGYFAEGVADDIITELSRNKDLFVVARQSSFRAKQETVDYRAIGSALGVRHLLTGSAGAPGTGSGCPFIWCSAKPAANCGRNAMTGLSTTSSRCSSTLLARSRRRWPGD